MRSFGSGAAGLRIRVEVGTVAKAQRKGVRRVELSYAAKGEPEPDDCLGFRVFSDFEVRGAGVWFLTLKLMSSYFGFCGHGSVR